MRKLDRDEILKRLSDRSENYDYSQVVYLNKRTKIKIICRKCGEEFYQLPLNHIKGSGCPKCYGKIKLTEKDFVERANIVHNNKYEYKIKKLNSLKDKIEIVCPIHGLFEQSANSHINNGHGCPKCFFEKSAFDRTKTINSFIEESNIIHCNKYDYSLVDYKNNSTKVKIICPIHGEFLQRPNCHLSGKQGCPKCKSSKGELKISNILAEMNIKFEEQKRFKDCRNKIPLIFDFYIPSIKTAIEYQGGQHYFSVKRFGGEEKLLKQKHNDAIKEEYCKNNGISLITIPYWKNVKEVLSATGIAN